jgi:hypothetical protein
MTTPGVVAAAPLEPPAVVLSLAGTDVERGVVDEFAREFPVVHDADQAVELAVASGARIAPLGVSWLPPERDDGRRFSVRDLRLLNSPRAQAKLLATAPKRCRVVVGEPAAVEELRERWQRHSGGGERFSSFVARRRASPSTALSEACSGRATRPHTTSSRTCWPAAASARAPPSWEKPRR